MKAENLVSLAAAHGIDLVKAAKMGSNVKPKRDVVMRRGARVLVPPAESRARGTETRTLDRPAWTLQEIGMAAHGVERHHFLAACFSFAGDRSNFWELHRSLIAQGKMYAMIYKWPPMITDYHGIQKPYLAHIAKLVLDVDASPHLFNVCPQLFEIYLGVTERVWEKQLQPKYEDLKHVFGDWLGIAARQIQSKLSEHEECP